MQNAGMSDLSSPVLQHAIKAFSPLKLRLGGSLQDRILYDIGDLIKECKPFSVDSSRLFGFNGGCLPMGRWDELNIFFQSVGAQVVFGLNALYGRRGHYSSLGPWNSTNSRNFIKYTHDQGYKISAWEFGNELSGHGVGTAISAKQYAADVKELRKIIEEVYADETLPQPLLIAPDGFYDEQWTIDFFEAFEKDSPTIDVLTLHLYSLGPGVDPDLKRKILNLSYVYKEAKMFQNVKQTLQEHGPSVDAWVGEAGGAYNSGHHLVTDAFVSGFWYLDQMAMAASYGTKAYCRQSLVGGNYGLLNTTTFEPNPDYYGALLWHRLMGTKVLNTKVMDSQLLRAYAHCGKGTEGVTLLLLNFCPSTVYQVDVLTQSASVSMDARKTERMEYHLTPKDGDLTSQIVLLNGEPLQVNKQGELPLLRPKVVADSAPLLVDPLSIAFVSLPYLHVAACSLSRW
ncbi:hypothetical protein GOP47_0014692 [Adiantum capillus-veneris]|uniref:Heparanase-like protein 3 n=1 Tax=Adiantum capillus-veneris TaxID=13818 RepID=A0A9D4UMI2_ADICA|nr:hypothetical protein GOP47_0014692 [Adiantum capillus-veneris]